MVQVSGCYRNFMLLEYLLTYPTKDSHDYTIPGLTILYPGGVKLCRYFTIPFVREI